MQISIEKKDNQKQETLLNTTWITKPVNGANYITVRDDNIENNINNYFPR